MPTSLFQVIGKCPGQSLYRSQYWLVDKYTCTSLTDPLVKQTMIKSFTAPESTLSIVIATSAFGMGVNCQRVRTVISFGAPEDVEDYIQQTGRVSRDGLPSKAALLWCADSIQHSSDKLKDYCETTDQCRRDFYFQIMTIMIRKTNQRGKIAVISVQKLTVMIMK